MQLAKPQTTLLIFIADQLVKGCPAVLQIRPDSYMSLISSPFGIENVSTNTKKNVDNL